MEESSENKTLGRIAELIGAELIGDGSIKINGINGLAAAKADEITFISDEKYLSKIKESSAGAIITSKRLEDVTVPLLLVKNVDAAVIEILKISPIPSVYLFPMSFES